MKKGEKGFIVVLKSVLLRGILTLRSFWISGIRHLPHLADLMWVRVKRGVLMFPFFTERRPSTLLKSGKRPWKCQRGKTEISGGKVCVYVNHRLLLVIYVSTKPCLKAKINDFSKQTLEHGKDIRDSNLISQAWHAKIRNLKQRRKIHWHSSQLAKRRKSVNEKSGINMWTVTIWFAVENVFFRWDLIDAAYYESEMNFL